ncbi:MOSC domain-containing protein [Xanthobacter autotrophicus]|uniref:MOSC domain-containing protein n=1 Tax=Xanthobacter autotrophicus TaxID=280 RepID=UPI0024A7378B|nr:MOSC domain-containing protein [Xanthobacter autotrophicus]MDI4658009.1 MOSC domain-containing protein [Xanthobacter autotrophicus]
MPAPVSTAPVPPVPAAPASTASAPSPALPTATLRALYRHPVKGLSPEAVEAVTLEAGAFFPGDRLYAVENGPSGFDADAPAHRPKTAYLMLMRNARLAGLASRYEPATATLTLSLDGHEAVSADLSTADGRAEVEAFLTFYMGEEARGPLRLLTAPEGFRFMDSRRSGFLSLLNLDSVRDLEARMGAALDPRRFRMNLHLEGWPAGTELALEGQRLTVGAAEIAVLKRTERCAAVNVNPQTAARDLNVVKGLMAAYGHTDCGIYAKVVRSGRVAVGDTVALA